MLHKSGRITSIAASTTQHSARTDIEAKRPVSVTLRPRKTVQHKPEKRTQWIFSWKGLEQYHEQIRSLA
jgi:hypothetical protein